MSLSYAFGVLILLVLVGLILFGEWILRKLRVLEDDDELL